MWHLASTLCLQLRTSHTLDDGRQVHIAWALYKLLLAQRCIYPTFSGHKRDGKPPIPTSQAERQTHHRRLEAVGCGVNVCFTYPDQEATIDLSLRRQH